ncbi:MAG: ferritin-like domain-containing protein [Thermoleophilaceae bacterium]
MPLHQISTVEELRSYLRAALQLEHATIPPYLTALYSIRPNTNADAVHVIRVVAVEEMLHLTLVANVLNAVGGKPDLTAADFVPDYPALLPDGEDDFQVNRERFSREALDTFLKIERPDPAPDKESRMVQRDEGDDRPMLATPGDDSLRFYSIGDFYAEIGRGLEHLDSETGGQLFTGDPTRQVGPEYYYSGGGEIVPVTDLDSALAALRLIGEQGEGLGGGIYDNEGELAHYYRFKQLHHGRYYLAGDDPDEPTGPELEVDWGAVYPVKTNAGLDDYPEGSELRTAALEFNRQYADFLAVLNDAYTGRPELLIDAVAEMFRLRDGMTNLLRNPIPGLDTLTAAPTFEVGAVPAVGSA